MSAQRMQAPPAPRRLVGAVVFATLAAATAFVAAVPADATPTATLPPSDAMVSFSQYEDADALASNDLLPSNVALAPVSPEPISLVSTEKTLLDDASDATLEAAEVGYTPGYPVPMANVRYEVLGSLATADAGGIGCSHRLRSSGVVNVRTG